MERERERQRIPRKLAGRKDKVRLGKSFFLFRHRIGFLSGFFSSVCLRVGEISVKVCCRMREWDLYGERGVA
jgi:hypothetical protein